MKYAFEYGEITTCLLCPFCKIFEYDDEDYCKLTGKWSKQEIPTWCPLEKVE